MAPYDDTIGNSKVLKENQELNPSDTVEQKPETKAQISEVVKLSKFNLANACKVHGCDLNTVACAVNVCKVNESNYLYNLNLNQLRVDQKNNALENKPVKKKIKASGVDDDQCEREDYCVMEDYCSPEDGCPVDDCTCEGHAGDECPTDFCNCIANDECWTFDGCPCNSPPPGCECDGIDRGRGASR
jgi:hypothetical protein